MGAHARPISLRWRRDAPPIGGLLRIPRRAAAALTTAHGAGAGMTHPFMEALAGALAEEGVATLRYEFPFMAAGRRRPDPPSVATAAVRTVVEAAADLVDGLPLFAGGKSFGGRMTSTAAAQGGLGVHGLVLFGFPLHPPGKPSAERAAHLARVERPMLFLQGTRDRLADLDLLRRVVSDLGERASLHLVDGADHGFHFLKRSRREEADGIRELAAVTASWIGDLLARASLAPERR